MPSNAVLKSSRAWLKAILSARLVASRIHRKTPCSSWSPMLAKRVRYQRDNLRNLTCKRIQCDEIWSFVYAKAKNVPAEYQGQFGKGDVWTWTAIDADTKLVPCWLVGTRGPQAAITFMRDVASRLTNRVQLTTDGYHCYLNAVDAAFPHEIDYAMLVKMYGTDPMGQRRYSPSICLSAESR